MKEEIKNVNVRIPVDLHERIVELAKREKRSLNNQILAALEKATEGVTISAPSETATQQ